MTSNSIDLIKATVRQGERVSVLSRIDVHREVEDGKLAFRTLADGRIKPEILSICVPARRPQSSTVVTVVEVLRRALMDMAAAL
jgi:DNA-binding transcriptional LysR family regulator